MIDFSQQTYVPDADEDGSVTVEQARLEIEKCRQIPTGFLYFLENYAWFSHPTLGKIKAGDNLYKWQRKAAVDFLQNRYFIFFKTRQTGCSTLKQAYDVWRAIFFKGQKIDIFSLDQETANDYLEKVCVIYDNLPVWMKTPEIERNKSTLTLKNKSRIKCKPNTPKGSRSGSLSCVLFDEYAFYPERTQSKILGATNPGLGPGAHTPFTSRSLPSQLFIISTLPMVAEGNEYMRILDNARDNPQTSKYKLINVDSSDVPFYQDESWHQEQLETLGPIKYSIEIKGIIPNTFDDCYFEKESLDLLKEVQPLRMDFIRPNDVDEQGLPNMDTILSMRDNYDATSGYAKGLWIYRDPQMNHEYGLMADVAAGVGGDSSSFHVFDLSTLEQVAEFKNNKIGTEDYKRLCLDVIQYYNNGLMSMERNSMGQPLCDWLREEAQYPGFHVYRISKKRYVAGFPLGPGNKPNVLASLRAALSSGSLKINGVRTINELKRFCYTPRGTIEGKDGSADDLVTSLAEFCYLRNTGFFVSGYDPEQSQDEDAEEEQQMKDEHTKKNHWLRSQFENLEEELTDREAEMAREMLAVSGGSSIDLKQMLRTIKSSAVLPTSSKSGSSMTQRRTSW